MKLIMVLICTSLLAQAAPASKITVNTMASSLFFDPNGNTGFASVTRSIDPDALVTTTTLFYSFCIETTAALCLQGNGTIPNEAFSGEVGANSSRTNVLTLNADTTVPGFTNELCQVEDGFPFNCVPANGGAIHLTFTKTDAFDEVINNNDRIRRKHVTTGTRMDRIDQFSGQMTGSILGGSVNTANIGGIMSFETLQRTGEEATQASPLLPGLARFLATQGGPGQQVLKQMMR